MMKILRDLNKLRHLLERKDRWKLVSLLGLMTSGSLMEALGIAAVPAYVTMIMNPSTLSRYWWAGAWAGEMPEELTIGLLFWASVALFMFVVVKNLFLTFVFDVQHKIVVAQRVNLSNRMFRSYQSAPYEWQLKRSSADFLRSVQIDTERTLNGVVLPFLSIVMASIMSVAIIAVLVVSAPGMIFWALIATTMGTLLLIRALQKRLRQMGAINRTEQKKQVKAIQQGFGTLVDTRIMGCEDYLRKVYQDSVQRTANVQRHFQTVQKFTPYAVEAITVLGLLTIVFLLVVGSDSLASVAPVVALLGVVMIRLRQMAGQIARSLNQLNASRIHLPAIVRDLAELEAVGKTQEADLQNADLINHFDSLKLQTVSYAYPDTAEPAIREISLELRQGESIALIGETGCGKSTLVNVILGLLKPRSGSIRVNGIDIARDLNGWYRQLGYIPQAVYLVDDTIRANIAFGKAANEADEQRLRHALHSACLADFIDSLPDGLETVIGERGVRLSGGQRQRLGIARALYSDPEVLVMDEATSALDNKTEKRVMQAIQNRAQGRTLIIIAHRLSTIEHCDRLYFLQDGRVKHSGTFDQLTETSFEFRELTSRYISGRADAQPD